jgi:hypothetical protein
MKKTIYILIIVFLAHEQSFASSFDFSNTIEAHFIEKLHQPHSNTTSQMNAKLVTTNVLYHNDLCKILSNECSKAVSIVYTERTECTQHPKLSYSFKEMDAMYTTTTYYPPSTIYEALNYKTAERLYAANAYPLTSNWKGLQTIDLEEYFSETINLSYSKGFGVRIRI